VNLDLLFSDAVRDAIAPGGSLAAFRVELIICAAILAVLLAKVFVPKWRGSAFFLAVVGLIAAGGMAYPWQWAAYQDTPTQPIFTAMLVSDGFTVGLRVLLILFTVLFVTFTRASGVCAEEDEPDFYALILGALLGMCLMISANHLLMVLLGMEMASLPCYVLAAMRRDRPRSSEAALKYAVFGAAAAGVMLFGMSLLVGVLGSAQLPTMTRRLIEIIRCGASPDQTIVLVLGGILLTVGVAFKLSAVPFHFWAPDVFEGATAEVAAFLSVASKAAALGLLVRLATAFCWPTGLAYPTDFALPAERIATAFDLAQVRQFVVGLIALLAAVTCTFGNLAAYGQTNMKRLLAYSTIAHAGYMMMPVAAAMSLLPGDSIAASDAITALLVYIGIYLFMNLAAFAIVAFLRNAIGSEEIADYAGLIRRSPGLTVCMAIVLFSLVGLPPLAGFMAKLTVFLALIDGRLWTLLAVAAANTVLSLFEYLRVVKVMTLMPEPSGRQAPTIPLSSTTGMYCALLTAPVVALFFLAGGLWNWANAAANTLFR